MAYTAETPDIELMRRLSGGDEQAFSEFYDRHQGGIYRFALHMTGQPHAASDVVQETFLTLIRQGGKFNADKGTPAAFLFGIARNHLRKLYEKEGRYVAFSGETENGYQAQQNGAQVNHTGDGRHVSSLRQSETVLEGLERAEAVALLRDAILTLPDHYREPVTLCDLEGKSYEEAADLLGCPVGTVRSRLNRARSILLEKLRPVRMGAKAQASRLGGKT